MSILLPVIHVIVLYPYTEDVLKLFCHADILANVTEVNTIEVSQLRDEFTDEVIEVDTTKLERCFSKEAWLALTDRGMHINCTRKTDHNSISLLFAVESMREKWKCHKCTDITYSDMVMCNHCQTWFHWYAWV